MVKIESRPYGCSIMVQAELDTIDNQTILNNIMIVLFIRKGYLR
jgi:hypothetical protein